MKELAVVILTYSLYIIVIAILPTVENMNIDIGEMTVT